MVRRFLAAAVLLLGLSPAATLAGGPPVNAEGLFTQPWFEASTGDLKADLAAARADGKTLAVLWEQKGCGYCRQMHTVNFRIAPDVAYIREHFHVVQMNLWGEDKVRDMDGSQVTQADLARRYNVTGTPMALFFKDDGTVAFLLPGYAPPPVFRAVFEYVQTRGYETATLREWFRQRGPGG